MNNPDQLFRINIAWMPGEDFEPEWIETTRGGYFSEYGSNEDELQEMIEAGAAIPLPIQEKPDLLSGVRKLVGEWRFQQKMCREPDASWAYGLCADQLESLLAQHPEVKP